MSFHAFFIIIGALIMKKMYLCRTPRAFEADKKMAEKIMA